MDRMRSGPLSLSDFQPFYQPIIRMDTLDIWGYEVLGRKAPVGGTVETLGPVFHSLNTDRPVDLASLIHLDHHLQETAIARLRESGKKTRLFINMMPKILSSLYSDSILDPYKMHLVNLVHKYDIDPAQIVIEITEDEFDGDIAKLVAIVDLFKKSGFLVAVDDVGAGMSDLSRIAYIGPDIIKVDLQLLRNSVTQVSFRQVLHAVSFLAHKLGSALLFEGIEKEEELSLALKLGARYLQGWIFSKAESDFQDKTKFKSFLEQAIQENSIYRIADMMYAYQMRDDVIRSIRKAAADIRPTEPGLNASLLAAVPGLPDVAMRIAIYDPRGNQVSALFEKDLRGSWIRDDSTRDANISWRPFFLQAIAQKEHAGQDWFVSEPHHDLQASFPRIYVCLVMDKNFVLVAELEWRV